jgi:hypothetical protein
MTIVHIVAQNYTEAVEEEPAGLESEGDSSEELVE